MSLKLTNRTSIAPVAALLLSVSIIAASPASAALATGETTVAHYQDGHKRGTMTHKDSGDLFRVCDTYADGSGVMGILSVQPVGGQWAIVAREDDGGDDLCDGFTYDIKDDQTYKMTICWRGSPTWAKDCTDKTLYE